jgi:hypothetical protein
MAIGRTWQESVQKALRGMEAGLDGWSLPKNYKRLPKDQLEYKLRVPNPDRMLYIKQVGARGPLRGRRREHMGRARRRRLQRPGPPPSAPLAAVTRPCPCRRARASPRSVAPTPTPNPRRTRTACPRPTSLSSPPSTPGGWRSCGSCTRSSSAWLGWGGQAGGQWRSGLGQACRSRRRAAGAPLPLQASTPHPPPIASPPPPAPQVAEDQAPERAGRGGPHQPQAPRLQRRRDRPPHG